MSVIHNEDRVNNTSKLKPIDSIQNDSEADKLINMYKDELQYYKSKNAQHARVYSKLKLSPDSSSEATKLLLEELTKLQDVCELQEMSEIAVGLSFNARLAIRNRYESDLTNLEYQAGVLNDLIKSVEVEVEKTEREIKVAKERIAEVSSISEEELRVLKMKLKSYEDKLREYFEKYPWLKSDKFNSLSIQEKIRTLYKLRDEKDELASKVKVYEGLKPDIHIAKTQLAQIKAEYENICKLIV